MKIDYPRAGRVGVRRWLPSWRQGLSLVAVGFVGLVAIFILAVALTKVPAPNDLASAQTTIVYWSDGKTELGRIGAANRINVALSDVPLNAQRAVLAAEDRDFYDHGGISPVGIGRSLVNNITGGSLQGGSTITQQYARNAYLTQERTFSRKINEVLLSFKLETTVSKDEILGDYLNTIYFGRGAYGIETASQQYFRTNSKNLTLAQGAAIAAIIRSPASYAPDRHPEKLKGRWLYVLDGMVQKGWITPAQKAAAVFPKFAPQLAVNRYGGTTGYLLDSVRQQLLAEGFTEDQLNLGGLRVISTFDRAAQAAVVAAVKDKSPKSEAAGVRIGVVSIRPGTGEVIAMYGGANYLVDPLNNATQALGQAGSTFKPFALAAATEQGISLNSTWNGDNKTEVDGYKVTNYGDKSWGTISLLKATEQSVNAVYVGVSQQVGYDQVVDSAVRAGIPDTTPALGPYRSVALGVASPHVIDVAAAYSTFAARGQQVAPTVILEVRGDNGGLLYQHTANVKQAFDSNTADTVNYALQKVVTNGTGRVAAGLGRPAAAKTGTTNDNKSAWFVGYTPQLVTAVMMVKDGPNNQPVSLSGTGGLSTVTGGSFPARIWTAYMKAALEGQPVQQFDRPADIPSASPSASVTVTPSATASPTPTVSNTPTASPTPSGSPTPNSTGTSTPTPTGSTTPIPTPSGSP